jgi:hypothetical protein
MPESMSHNEFEFYKHVIRPMSLFFIKLGIKTSATRRMPNMVPAQVFYNDLDFERYFRRERMKNYKSKRENEL